MNTKHTPGPWVTNGLIVSARVGASQCNVCEVSASAPCGGRTYKAAEHMPELQANARLIAASPDLLAKLADADAFIASLAAGLHLDEHFPHDKRCEYGGGVLEPDWKSVAEMRQEIAEAITKTTGEQA